MTTQKNSTTAPEKENLDLALDHGILIKDRVIQLTGEIQDNSFDLFDVAMHELERKSRKGITIKINSPGGSVYEALAIIGRIRASKCHITTLGFGHVMSAATIILAAGNTRKISKYCTFMAHEASYAVEGKHSDIKDEVAQAEKEESLWSYWMEELSTTPQDFWLDATKRKNFYLDAEECLNHGVVDDIF